MLERWLSGQELEPSLGLHWYFIHIHIHTHVHITKRKSLLKGKFFFTYQIGKDEKLANTILTQVWWKCVFLYYS